MKKNLTVFILLFGLIVMSQLGIAAPFFKVSSTGLSPEKISITLCLNGKGPITCQNYNVSSLNLSIRTTVPNRTYNSVGIKVNMAGSYPLSGCTPISNGFCIFSANDVTDAKLLTSAALYNVVFDAGSSGTRVFVYQTIAPANPRPLVVILYTMSNSIPLASFAANPAGAGPSIQPLLTQATRVLQTYNVIPPQATAAVLGTAGMRALTQPQQAAIYQSVDTTIDNNNYILGETRTITGQQEGLFQWLDVNYLSDSLGTNITHGIIEIGGASAQVAFNSNTAVNSNVIKVTINSVVYDIFSISFLGLGQDLARDTMNALTPPFNPNYCYPVGYNQGSIMGDFFYGGCISNYDDVISSFPSLAQISSVAGFESQRYYGVGSIYFNAMFLGLSTNLDPSSTASAITSICANTFAELQQLYPSAFELYNRCADSTYMDSFLFSSIGLNLTTQPVTPAAAISDVPISWTGGYVFFLNKIPSILG